MSYLRNISGYLPSFRSVAWFAFGLLVGSWSFYYYIFMPQAMGLISARVQLQGELAQKGIMKSMYAETVFSIARNGQGEEQRLARSTIEEIQTIKRSQMKNDGLSEKEINHVLDPINTNSEPSEKWVRETIVEIQDQRKFLMESNKETNKIKQNIEEKLSHSIWYPHYLDSLEL